MTQSDRALEHQPERKTHTVTIVEELRVELNRRNQTIESAVQRVLYWGHRAQQAERRADEAERQLGIARSQLEHLRAR